MTTPSYSSYAPDDARIKVSALEFLHGDAGTALRTAVGDLLAIRSEPTVSDVASFRKQFSADIVHAAFALCRLQSSALGLHGKFPELAFLWAVPEALEQATDSGVARHKASRFAAAGVKQIVDMCAGIGGDTLALANVAPVTAIDLSPLRTLCLRWNIEAAAPVFPVTVRTEDTCQCLPTLVATGGAFHIDPSRRSEGKRSPRYEDLIPGPEVLVQIMRHFGQTGGLGGGIKLSSAVDFDSLPAGHLELISHNRTVVQAVLWTGHLAASIVAPAAGAPPSRTATLLKNNRSVFSYTAEFRPVPFIGEASLSPSELPPYLYEVDGAFTRAALAAPLAEMLHLTAWTPDGGYLAGQFLLEHPALTGFSVVSVVPYSEQRVAEALLHAGGEPGPIEVKTRGGVQNMDTDRLQKLWTKAAPFKRTVFVFRYGGDVLAIIAQRLA